MRNKIAWKLTLYFAAVLLIFALVVGGTFMYFFRQAYAGSEKERDAGAGDEDRRGTAG